MRVIASGLQFPEGPVAMDDGRVLVVELERGTLTRVGTNGSTEVIADCGGGPNGAAMGPDGHVYVANDGGLAFTDGDGIRFPVDIPPTNTGGSIHRVDLASGAHVDVHTHVDDHRLGVLNDIVFDSAGNFYVVDTSCGAIYRGAPDGTSIRTMADGLEAPNGLGLAPGGDRLYASETYSGRVFAWRVAADGTLEDRTLVHQAVGHGWDGLAVDGAGNICIANLQRSGISIVRPDGELLEEITLPLHDPYVTNLCFGGADGRVAYICSGGRGLLYAVDWPWPGLRPHFSC